jgi:hypothetical protein
MKLDLSLPIKVRPYTKDAEYIASMSGKEDRPQSNIVRQLLHEAILARQDIVSVPIVGKLNSETTPMSIEEELARR